MTDIIIGDKEYRVKIAQSQEEKTIGLSKTKSLPEDEGMLFVYDEPQEELYFTMKDTSIDLDIIFIDKSGEVLSVYSVKAFDPNPVYEEDAMFVLEVNINSGIQEGDILKEDDFSEEDKKQIANSKMLILDENGDVQFKLESGERIVSRIETRKLIKAALKAYRSDEDTAYKKVGKLIFKILDGQDNRDAEYVSLPD